MENENFPNVYISDLYYSVIICISEHNVQEVISIHNNILDY